MSKLVLIQKTQYVVVNTPLAFFLSQSSNNFASSPPQATDFLLHFTRP